MREPLLAPLAAIATGILVSRFVPLEIRELYTVIAAFTILCILSMWRRARALASVCCLLALAAGGALVDGVHRPGSPPVLDAIGRETVILAGCVVMPSVFSADREQFVLELDPGARMRINLYVKPNEPAPALRYGQKVEIEARVHHPHNFENPGAFDYVHYLARRNIFWTASASASAPLRILPGRCGNRFMQAIFTLRTAALDRLERLYPGNPYDLGMMQAILIGETANLQKVWTEQFRSTGTFHTLVISGLHVAVLAGFILLLLRLCFVPESVALVLTASAIWIYALVTGWQTPAVRSATALTLFMVGRSFYRERRSMNLLAAAAIGFLVLDPESVFDPSFQLSFLAVGFLAAFAIPLVECTSGPLARSLGDLAGSGRDMYLERRAAQFRVEMRLLAETVRLWTRFPERVCALLVTTPARVCFFFYETALISAVIQIGLALPMAVYFHRVSLSGLSANAFVVPLLCLAVPVGFVAVFTGWVLPAKAAGGLLWLSQTVVSWHAHWEPNWRIPAPPLWLGIAFSAALIAAALAHRVSSMFRAAAVLAIFTFLALIVWHPFAPRVEKGWLEIAVIDVGQGDSILVALPDGKLMLMDGGGIPSFGGRSAKTNLDIGEDVVSSYLWNRSIRSLEVVALSHAHDDHIQGLRAVLQNFHVKELWTGATPDSPEWNALRDQAIRDGVKIVPMQQGRHFDYGGAVFEVLAPVPGYTPAESPKNNDSLALRLSFGERSFLLTGDIERKVESDLLAANLVQKVDVLKVAHHGSKTSSTEAFLEAAQPEFALISDGFENSYGHPHPDVLARLRAQHAEVLRTDQVGLISIRTDGRRFEVETWLWTAPGRLLPVF